MQRSNLMPLFWAKLVAPALLLGLAASGCAAGGGRDGRSDDMTLTPSAPSSPSNPVTSPALASPAPPATAPNTQTSSGAASNAASTPAVNASEAANAASNAESEAARAPGRDANAEPQDGDDDDDEADDEDDRRDDDDGDDDDDDDGSDDVGTTPASNPPPANPGDQNPAPDALTFSADIRPILISNCGRCHASGGLPQFASANAATGFDVAFQERNAIISEIRSGNMPADTCNGAPGSNGCVSVADFNSIQQWVAAGAPE
jgi:hypothetical protein